MLSPRLLVSLLALATSACWVPDVNLAGKACDLQHSCDDGYCCVPAGTADCGATTAPIVDGGFVCLKEGTQ